MNLGNKIKKLRKDNNLTQVDLAEKLGLSAITIRKYESNEREPNIDTLLKIAEVFNVNLASFLDNEFKNVSPIQQKLIYRFSNTARLIENILEFFGYGFEGYELSDGEYESYIITKNGEKLLIKNGELDEFIDHVKDVLEFEIYKLEKRISKK